MSALVAVLATTTPATADTSNTRSATVTARTATALWPITRIQSRRRTVLFPSYPVEEGLTQRAIAVHRAALDAWPQIKTYYGYRNDPSSDHYYGRALDLMIPDYTSTAGKALGSSVALWAKANQQSLGIEYVIWNQHIWSVARASEGWRLMADRGSDSANHKNHVHISVLK